MSCTTRLPIPTCLVAAGLLASSGCYTSAAVLDRDDGGPDAWAPMPDTGPRSTTDAFALPVDAAPLDAASSARACSASAPCGPGSYCDFGGGCGSADATGVCVEASVCSPSGGLVCGCDGRDYLAPCEAHAAGTDVAIGPGCASAPVSDRVAVTTRACAPDGGLAWTFTIAGTDTACDDDRPGLRITLFSDLATLPPGTAFDLDAAHAAGLAWSCPYGLHAACVALQGTVVVDAFDEGAGAAAITYGLVGHAGTRDVPIDVRVLEHAVAVGTWCAGAPTCS